MDNVVVILDWDSAAAGECYFRTALALGLTPILFENGSEHPYAAGFQAVDLAERTSSAIVAAVEHVGRRRVRGIISVDDKGAEAAAGAAEALGLAGPDPKSVAVCQDKFLTRRVLLEAGVENVPFALARSGGEAANATRAIGAPVVVKPRTASGSYGVKVCRSPKDARLHYEMLAGHMGDVQDEGVVVEAFIEGPQFSVFTFDGRAVAVSRIHVSPPPYSLIVGSDCPPAESALTRKNLAIRGEEIINAVGLSRGPGFAEFRLAEATPRLIEINPRVVAGMQHEVIRLATGVDLVETAIRFACGMSYDPFANGHGRASALRWLVRPSVPVRQVLGRERAAAVVGVERAGLMRDGFDREGPASDARDRIGYVIAEAGTPAAAVERAELGLSMFRVIRGKARPRWRRAARSLIASAVRRVPGGSQLRAWLEKWPLIRRASSGSWPLGRKKIREDKD